MNVRVLGSAAGGGFPQWNCNCANCAGLRNGSIRAVPRTQSSIAVRGQGTGWVLFNASPDIRTQLESFPGLQPKQGVRDTGIVGIVLIDSQIDHTTGLLILREGEPLEVYCTDRARQDLTQGNPIFEVLGHYCGVNWHPVPIEQGASFGVQGAENLRFQAVALESKAPPYSPHREDPHPGDTIGVRIEDLENGTSLFYAPGLGRVDTSIAALMAEVDCLLIDGTFWRDDELSAAGVGPKRAAEMGHLPQSGETGMMRVLAPLQRQRKILIHINNTNPILNEDSAERAELTKAGIEVAYDGMDITL